MNKINHQILCILLDYIYVTKVYISYTSVLAIRIVVLMVNYVLIIGSFHTVYFLS